MIYEARKAPAPSATGWVFDLTDVRGPVLAVLRRTEVDAGTALAEHLVDAGSVADAQEAIDLTGHVDPIPVAVIW